MKIRAVAYIRRSSHRQAASLKEQRLGISGLVDRRGYNLLRWYEDTKSGDDDARPGFADLMHDALSESCPFDVIVCYEQGRFSRLDRSSANIIFTRLRDAGVMVETVVEGVILDPEAEGDSELAADLARDVRQHGKHQYIVDLAQALSRHRIELAKKGVFGGQVPYGMRRTPDGRIEPGDAAEIAVVVWIYEAFLAGWSRTAIARKLTMDGVPAPATGKWRNHAELSGRWHRKTVTCILRNRSYCGERRYAETHNGKHYRIRSTGPQRVPRRERGLVFADPAGAIVPDVPPVLGKPVIPVSQWAEVQIKLDAAVEGRDNPKSLPLSGLVVCGLCGRKMFSGRVERPSRNYEYYFCKGYTRNEDVNNKVHRGITIRADLLWVIVMSQLHKDVFDRIDAIAKDVENSLACIAVSGKARVQSLDEQVAETSRAIATVRGNMLYAPSPQISAEFAAELTRLQDEHKRLAIEASAARALSGAASKGSRQRALTIKQSLAEEKKRCLSKDSREASRAVSDIVETITVTVTERGRQRKREVRMKYRSPKVGNSEPTGTNRSHISNILEWLETKQKSTKNPPS